MASWFACDMQIFLKIVLEESGRGVLPLLQRVQTKRLISAWRRHRLTPRGQDNLVPDYLTLTGTSYLGDYQGCRGSRDRR